ncbi:MAG: FAD-binding protein [Brasilonema octagenarum HA4186-MV1]|jgi:FAD/FMN-containing dehydrogenase|nr:FAD-binding protein [Brasilonema octagenarum HA4186-MV1]
MNSIISDIKCIVEGEVTNTPEILGDVSQDFGRIIQKQPQLVVRPQNSADVVQVVKYALEQGLTISPRAGGNSLGGQCLNQDGIVLDMRNFNQIHEIQKEMLWFQADTGVTWREVIVSSLPHGLIPPSLTNYIDATLGGTHSAGGLGNSSFRYGTQADNCLGLEVVTGTGELVWCTPEENSELFYHVLCGYGQFGIITQVRHRLRRYRPSTRTYFLLYDNLDAFLNDKQVLTQEGRIDYLLSVPNSCLELFSKAVRKPLMQWFYLLQVTVEADSTNSINDEEVLSGLNFYRHIHTQDLNFDEFVIPALKVGAPSNTVHPWIDLLIPGSKAKTYIQTVLERLPSILDCGNTLIGSFCLFQHTTNMPMFRVPDEDFIVGLGIYPIIPKSQLQPVLAELESLTELGLKMGAKRYLTGWVKFDLQQWRVQFGDYWSTVNEIKRKYDPQAILNPGFLQYERVAHPHEIYKQQTHLTEDAIAKSRSVA